MKKFNINYYVKVKLSDYGREIYNNDQLDIMARMPPAANITPIELKEDQEGYSKWQMWELMALFGTFMGMGRKQPFGANILIDMTASQEAHPEGEIL